MKTLTKPDEPIILVSDGVETSLERRVSEFPITPPDQVMVERCGRRISSGMERWREECARNKGNLYFLA